MSTSSEAPVPVGTPAIRGDRIEDLRVGGISWSLRASFRPEIERIFGRAGGTQGPERIAGCEAVKTTPKRTVWRLPLATRTVYVKRYRMGGWRECAKYLLARPRARAEWHNAQSLREAGFDVPEPLAVGVSRRGLLPGDAWLFAAELPGERLDDVIAELRDAGRDREPLLRAVVALHERLLLAGFVHPDLHGGNLLVRRQSGAPRIGLVDLHAIRRAARPPARRSIERVRAKLAHSLWLLLEEGEFDVFLSLLAPSDASRVRRAALRIERVRLRSRSRRCARVSTSFARDRRAGWRVWRRRCVDLDSLLELVREGAREGSARVMIAGEPRTVEVRLFSPLRSRRAMRGWKGAHALDVRAIPGRLAFAHMRRWRFGVPAESILVTASLPGAVRLDRIDPSSLPSERLLRAALESAVRHHRFGLRARPEELLALRRGDGWQVVRDGLVGVPPDRPLDPERAARDLAAIRAATASQRTPDGSS